MNKCWKYACISSPSPAKEVVPLVGDAVEEIYEFDDLIYGESSDAQDYMDHVLRKQADRSKPKQNGEAIQAVKERQARLRHQQYIVILLYNVKQRQQIIIGILNGWECWLVGWVAHTYYLCTPHVVHEL